MRTLTLLALAALTNSLIGCGGPVDEATASTDQASNIAPIDTQPISRVDRRPDLVPALQISDSGHPYTCPPTSIGLRNLGLSAAAASELRFECFSYNSGGYYVGQCLSTMVFDVPALSPDELFVPSLPWTPGPLACQAARCVVRLTAGSTELVSETNEVDNRVEREKVP